MRERDYWTNRFFENGFFSHESNIYLFRQSEAQMEEKFMVAITSKNRRIYLVPHLKGCMLWYPGSEFIQDTTMDSRIANHARTAIHFSLASLKLRLDQSRNPGLLSWRK